MVRMIRIFLEGPAYAKPHFFKNTKQNLIRHEVFDKIWIILVILGLAFMIVSGIVIQILHHP